jgi:hypothetical protein
MSDLIKPENQVQCDAPKSAQTEARQPAKTPINEDIIREITAATNAIRDKHPPVEKSNLRKSRLRPPVNPNPEPPPHHRYHDRSIYAVRTGGRGVRRMCGAPPDVLLNDVRVLQHLLAAAVSLLEDGVMVIDERSLYEDQEEMRIVKSHDRRYTLRTRPKQRNGRW